MNHFKLTSESTVNLFGVKLFRVELTTDCKWGEIGDKGGFIEKEENLCDNAWILGNAKIWGDAEISGDARISGNAEIWGNAKISGNAEISGNAKISGNAEIWGNAWISGNVEIWGNAKISGNAEIWGNARIWGNAKISGDAEISGDARISVDVVSTKKVFTLNFCYFLTLTDNHIRFGCVQKTIQEWIDWLSSDDVIETKRDLPKFKLIRLSLELAIEQYNQLNKKP